MAPRLQVIKWHHTVLPRQHIPTIRQTENSDERKHPVDLKDSLTIPTANDFTRADEVHMKVSPIIFYKDPLSCSSNFFFFSFLPSYFLSLSPGAGLIMCEPQLGGEESS